MGRHEGSVDGRMNIVPANENEPLEIKVKYHVEQPELEFVEGKSDWIDLRAAYTIAMKAFEFRVISLGISVKLPEGYEAHIAPRSSTYRNWGVIQANSIGVIDETYCGEDDVWGFPALAMRDTVIYKGDRICQFRIMKKMPPDTKITAVDHMEDESRGGFGSTGTN